METDKYYLQKAIDCAKENVLSGKGGPFGALIVKGSEIIACTANSVTLLNDPTAHAEILAIKMACKALKTFVLSDCTIYSSCEPCPMCLGAIYWAKLSRLVYAATKEDAAKAGFADQLIYKELDLKPDQRILPSIQIHLPQNGLPFEAWMQLEDKIKY
ncbi:MAG: nucleoside deaminase [Bacteroidales bacterium]|jgi:guanine deaminase|nr:nucleoside deaminase [Bacteroidales bacterium]